jgi:hypothetical protein
MFEREEIVHALDRAATMIDFSYVYGQVIILDDGKDLEGDGCSLLDGWLLLEYIETKENHFNQVPGSILYSSRLRPEYKSSDSGEPTCLVSHMDE